MKYVAAIDQGTTSTRCFLFDRAGQPKAGAQQEHRQIYPRPGWVEHDPVEIWDRTQRVFAEALDLVRAEPGDLAAIGITNQRETTVIWEKAAAGRSTMPSSGRIRARRPVCRPGRAGGQEPLPPQNGLLLAPIFPARKSPGCWTRYPAHGSGPRRAISVRDDRFLAGLESDRRAHVTDVTNAGRTLLMNLQTLDWDEDLLRELAVPRANAAPDRPSSEVYGITAPGVPVSGILGDQQAALFGQTCFSPGEAKNTYGTGCFMLLNTGETAVPSKSGLLTTLGYQSGDNPRSMPWKARLP